MNTAVSRPFREIGRDQMYNTWHRISEGAELLFVLSGSGSVVFKSGVYPLVRGGLYYISRDALHYTLPDDVQSYDRIKMIIAPTVIGADREISEFLGEKEAVFALLDEKRIKEVSDLFDNISSGATAEMKNAEDLANAIKLLVMLCRYSEGALSSPSDTMSKVISYINTHISEQITIDTLCDVSHTSKYHLCRKFKKNMGMTIGEYITDTRVELAKEILVSKRDLSVSEISEMCGFSNVAYFCAVFKRQTETTPLAYRQKQK